MTTQTDRRDWVTSARSEIPSRVSRFFKALQPGKFPSPSCGPFALRPMRPTGKRRRFQFCIERFQSVGRLFLQLPRRRLGVYKSIFWLIYLCYQCIASNTKSMTATCTNFWRLNRARAELRRPRANGRRTAASASTRRSRCRSSARSRTRARHGAHRRGKTRFGGAPPPPSFSPSFSKSRLFFSKLFQRKLWPFCGISMGCKASKPNSVLFQIFCFLLGLEEPVARGQTNGDR